jgi:cell division transport system ATP-binding protein
MRNVTKSYKTSTRPALDNVSVEVDKGEFVFIIGPSGSGKSTFMRLLLKEETPTAGEIRVADFRVDRLPGRKVPKLRQRIGCVFQDFRLLQQKTVEQNVAFALEVTGAPAGVIGGKVNRVLTQVGLASKGRAFPRELSGGEQQRVAIARALVNDPFALIADEPTGNLDDRATRGIFQLLREINAAGTAIIMATHNMELIRRQEYRTIEMARGQIVFDSAESAAAPDAAV